MEGGAHRSHIAPMAVEKIEMVKSLARERSDIVFDQRHKGGCPHADCTRKMQVKWCHTESDRGAHQSASDFAGSHGDGFRADRVGCNQSVRSMLFDRTYRNDDSG